MAVFYIDNIVSISSQGILCKDSTEEVNIEFEECVKNFLIDFPSSSGKCVATSDILSGYYTFYTEPRTIIKVKKEKCIFHFFKRQKRIEQFISLQKEVYKHGFTTYDLT